MADLIAQSAAWLEDQRDRHLTSPVIYRRGGESVALQATIGRTVFRDERGYGTVTHTVTRDYLVRADALVLDGVEVTPLPGDQVLEVQGDKLLVHEVMAPTVDDPAWRYSDVYRITLRIHTKLVGEEPLP